MFYLDGPCLGNLRMLGFRPGLSEERTARSCEQDCFYFVLFLALYALEDGCVFAVYRDQPSAAAPGCIGDEPSACHQRLLVGKGHSLARLQSRQGRTQSHHTAEGIENQFCLGHRSRLTEPFLPFQHGNSSAGKFFPQPGCRNFIVHNSVARKKLPRLRRNAVHITVGCDGDD